MRSYHPELADRMRPALMDEYEEARPDRTAMHDKLTKAFIIDRVAAKVSR